MGNTSMAADNSQKQERGDRWSNEVHFASLIDLCHLKSSELEPQDQKDKGSVVLRGKSLKDDSGSYAVFTEQRSSASQMTAAKVMDIISRLRGCAGQAADAVSAYTQVKMEDAPNFVEKFRSQIVQISGFVYHDTIGLNHGPVWKIQSFLLSEICTVILWQDCYGRGNSRMLYSNTVGEEFQIENAYSETEKKDYSYQCMWTISHWHARNRTSIRIGKFLWKTLIWENNHFSWPCFFGLHSKRMSDQQGYFG